jgi:hypothetical protein
MKHGEPSRADRMKASANAKKAEIAKAHARLPANDPGFGERQAARRAVGIARDLRIAERKAATLAEAARAAAEQAAREVVLEAERKTARDLRYAARKARKR